MGYRIALLPGDGIGPEVVDATVPVLETVGESNGISFEYTRFDWGSSRYLDQGSMLPGDAPDQLRGFDAILHGAMGDPSVPDHISSREGHLSIRKAFDHYLNLRPAYLYNAEMSPLTGYRNGAVDIEWYRENTEGEYLDVGGRLNRGGATEMAIQSAVYTRDGIERVVRAAFDAAESRSGRLTSVTKSNALSHTPVFWDEIVAEISREHPTVPIEELHVDAAALALVERPDSFDVVVAPNLYSDILTDLTAGITGGIGLAPSANLNPNDEGVPGMFEPVHGSAPDIAGRGIANPIAEILSAAMMLEDLGEETASAKIETVVAEHLVDADAPRTPDLGGRDSTEDVVTDLVRRV